ncbi:4860_t:CDS:2 [Paraglomus occultum]|uniref:4860_t:CDS:1 n=1 Tax=Paraglomus occultum TaxID=144539 RepID=A0A9N9B219_9GLOM|nr:4860_t:CDS:2 [Paraglomus occultum]
MSKDGEAVAVKSKDGVTVKEIAIKSKDGEAVALKSKDGVTVKEITIFKSKDVGSEGNGS